MEWEKIVSNDATDKGLISKIYKQLTPFDRKETNSWPWRIDLWLPRGREWNGLGVWGNRCKLFYLEWISNEILLYSIGNYI